MRNMGVRAGVFLCVAIVLCAFSLLPCAKGNVPGNVRGVVHDPQHRPIAGARAALQSRTADWRQTIQTNENGEFSFAAVPLGDYLLTVSHSGFQRVIVQLTVTAEPGPILHIPLNLAAAHESVTVTGEAAAAGTESVTPRTLVSRSEIRQTAGADRTNGLQMITDFVPGAYLTHDQLHIRGGHQVSWLLDGVPIPNANIASSLGPQVNPKDVDYLEIERGSYQATTGDRTYGVFDVVPRTGFDSNNQAELTITAGNFYQTDDQLTFGSHTSRLAYFASLDGNRSNLGLETPIGRIFHDAENGQGGFGSLIFNATPKDQLRWVSGLRRDYYQIPYDPNPNDPENQQFDTSGRRDADAETDAYTILSWVRTLGSHTVLTISPFYHYNRTRYQGGPNDPPSEETSQETGSSYAGLQALFVATIGRNDLQAAAYGFAQYAPEEFVSANSAGSMSPLGGVADESLDDKFRVTPALTLMAGIRASQFRSNAASGLSENATSPRAGAALKIPHLGWVLRAFYGHYYQPPPLLTVTGSLAGTSAPAFAVLSGERDEEHQFGLTIPLRGWTLDADTFETRARNFFDHSNLGESNVFFPITIEGALINAWELTLRSPRLWNRGQIHLAYSNQVAGARGAITGGPGSGTRVCSNPDLLAYCPLDHDQRNTLSAGFDASLPGHTFASSNIYYGSGFTNETPPPDYLPGHTTVDLSIGKDFGERYSLALTALNIANRHLLIDNSLTFGGFHYNDSREIYGEFRVHFHY